MWKVNKWIMLFILSVTSLMLQAEDKRLESTSTYKEIMEKLPTALESMRQHKQALINKGVIPAEENNNAMGKRLGQLKNKIISPYKNAYLSFSQKRDPFASSRLMHKTSREGKSGGSINFRAKPNTFTPDLKLRGILDGNEEKEKIGLIEVAGEGVFLVREGDTFSVRSVGKNVVVKIKKINSLSLMVEMGTLGEVIIVR